VESYIDGLVEAKVATHFEGVIPYFNRSFQRLKAKMEGYNRTLKRLEVGLRQGMDGLRQDIEGSIEENMEVIKNDLSEIKKGQKWLWVDLILDVVVGTIGFVILLQFTSSSRQPNTFIN
jgi:hypothetical protein